jgi:hypothetical protein
MEEVISTFQLCLMQEPCTLLRGYGVAFHFYTLKQSTLNNMKETFIPMHIDLIQTYAKKYPLKKCNQGLEENLNPHKEQRK